MVNKIPEKRKYQRRNITFSVLLSSINKQGDRDNDLCLGNIIDVGLGGVCIQTHCSYDIATGGKVLLLASTGEIEEGNGSDLPVEIRGEVVWKRSEDHSLGIRYL
jgi:PilZ domain